MYGLPGSGKTHTAMKIYNSLKDKCFDKVVYISLDTQEDYVTFQNYPDYGASRSGGGITLIFDGYFYDTKQLADKLNTWENIPTDYWKQQCFRGQDITIHYFIPNKEACLENDKGRRLVNSNVTIEKGIQPPDLDLLRKLLVKEDRYWFKSCKITIENHEVVVYKDKSIPINFIQSEWRYGENASEFTELDNYLEKHYPTCSFLQYKKISKFIKVTDERTYDYYDTNGTVSYMRYISIDDIKSVMEV